MSTVPEAYAHLATAPVSSIKELEGLAQDVYRSRVLSVQADADAGAAILRESLQEGRIDPESLHAHQEGVHQIATSLSVELYREYQEARAALVSTLMAREVDSLVGAAAFVAGLGVVLAVTLRVLRRS